MERHLSVFHTHQSSSQLVVFALALVTDFFQREDFLARKFSYPLLSNGGC
jgi:hypothetical protein